MCRLTFVLESGVVSPAFTRAYRHSTLGARNIIIIIVVIIYLFKNNKRMNQIGKTEQDNMAKRQLPYG